METFKLPSLNGPAGWPNVWYASKNQPLSVDIDAQGSCVLQKGKKYTLHLALNSETEDLKTLRAGRGVKLGSVRAFAVCLDSESETVDAKLVIHEFDALGRRLARHVLSNGERAIYVAASETDSLVISVRTQGEGTLRIRSVSFSLIEAFEDMDPGLHLFGAGSEVASDSSSSAPSQLGDAFGITSPLWGVGPEFAYAARIREAPGTYETFALRSRSVAIRDAFARNATNMQFDFKQMIRVLRVMRGGKLRGGAATVKTWNVRGLLILARTIANQRQRPTDLAHAELIFNVVLKVHGAEHFGRTDKLVFIEVLSGLGLWNEAHRVARTIRAFRGQPVQAMLFDANYALAAGESAREETWLDIVNAMYEREGIAPVRFAPSVGAKRLDRLEGIVRPRTVEGPKVSVLVPSYEGTELIRTTLESLVAQTWRDLEIIVIDDGSSAETQDALITICESYPEVRLVLMPENKGAYVARNEGLQRSTGEFITVHDDDDWSHPQKIELQMKHLLDNPDIRGNMSRHARATDELITTRINNNPLVSQANFSSLLVRRRVFEEVGPWDNVNRGADAEFRDRLLVAGEGGEVSIIGEAPLSFTRTRDVSLTAGELGRGYVDPARLFYVSAYQKAHNTHSYQEFARPRNMMPGMRNVPLGRFDVVFLTDFRFPGGTTHLTVNEIERAAALGKSVGILHLGSSVNGMRPPIHPRALEAARMGNVSVLSPKDDFHTDLLIVRHPTVLQYADNLTVGFSVGKCVVVVNHPPVLVGGRGYVYDLEDCAKNARNLFGSAVAFQAESGVTRRLVRAVQSDFPLEEELWPGFATASPRAPREVKPAKRPVLGRHSRDSALKWPDQANQVLSAYAGSEDLDVRVLGGISSLPEPLQDELRKRADVLEFNEEPVEDFLESIDFWAYFHSSSLTESFGMSTVEALLSGAVVILPPYMEENFGDGALYAEPESVQQIIRELWNDPEAYRAQSAAGLRVAQELYSKEAFDARLAKHLAGEEPFAGK